MASQDSSVPNADGQQQRKRRPWWRWLFCFIFLLCLAAVIALVGYEMKTPTCSHRRSPLCGHPDLSARTRPQADCLPDDGPFDKRLGYVLMPMIQERLVQRVATR